MGEKFKERSLRRFNANDMVRTLLLLSTFLSAGLLFMLQPLYAKFILPQFGGSSAVWTISMFFYSSVLLVGYLYAALLNQWPSRLARFVHTILLLIAGGLLLSRWLATGAPLFTDVVTVGEPAVSVFLTLLHILGLPVLLLSSTSVIAQKLYAQHTKREPYSLFAVSNAGSLLGLLLYPFLFEPFTFLSLQAIWWMIGFVLFILFFLSSWRQIELSTVPDQYRNERPIKLQKPVKIIFLAAVPTFLLASGTELFSSGIASFPLLWVMPLALYLTTFIFAFKGTQTVFDRLAIGPLTLFLLVPVLLTLPYIGLNSALYWLSFLWFAAFFFFGCFYFHRRIYELRPQLSQLGNFYVLVTFGGALGSGAVGFLLPLILNDQVELYIVLGFLLVFFSRRYLGKLLKNISQQYVAVVRMIVYVWAGLFIFAMTLNGDALVKERNFYGTLMVQDREYVVDSEAVPVRVIYNGATNHGQQPLTEPFTSQPLSYYGPGSGIAIALAELQRKEIVPNLLVIGLGAGMASTYCDQVAALEFIEINPAVVDIAYKYFTFLELCPEKTTITIGDGRLELEQKDRVKQKPIDVIMVDAFTDDSIPAHLLTKEALTNAYGPLLSENGIIAFHVSNRYLDLMPPIVGAARQEGYEAVVVNARTDDRSVLQNPSVWMLVTRPENSKSLLRYENTVSYDGAELVWTDEKNSVMQVLSLTGSIDW